MRVLLTGATGFLGSHVLRLLHDRGVTPRCLVRPGGEHPIKDVEAIEGDLDEPASLEPAFRGVDTLINTASLGFGHAPAVVSAAERARIARAIFISTTAIFTTLNVQSKNVRLAAEASITHSSLDYTILRPTMIYGTARDRNMVRLIRYLRRWPVLPILGDGERLQQPVYVGDVASAVMHALESPAASRHAYNTSGGSVLTFNDVVDTIATLMKRRITKLHVSLQPALKVLTLAERLRISLPIRAEQILRLNEDKTFEYADAARDFGYAPISFSEGIRRELCDMGFLSS